MCDSDSDCPLCSEPMKPDDLAFYPCECKYQICRFCWTKLKYEDNGLCPNCRKQYGDEPVIIDKMLLQQNGTDDSKARNKKKRKDQVKAKFDTDYLKRLPELRVVQANLIFVIGLPSSIISQKDALRGLDYFGKYGEVFKIEINQNPAFQNVHGEPSLSAYVTYKKPESAMRAINELNQNKALCGETRILKVSLGTTKYCSQFLKGTKCTKHECMYLHEIGDREASFTKEEMQAGKHSEYMSKLLNDFLVSSQNVQQNVQAHSTSLQQNSSQSRQQQHQQPSSMTSSTNNVTSTTTTTTNTNNNIASHPKMLNGSADSSSLSNSLNKSSSNRARTQCEPVSPSSNNVVSTTSKPSTNSSKQQFTSAPWSISSNMDEVNSHVKLPSARKADRVENGKIEINTPVSSSIFEDHQLLFRQNLSEGNSSSSLMLNSSNNNNNNKSDMVHSEYDNCLSSNRNSQSNHPGRFNTFSSFINQTPRNNHFEPLSSSLDCQMLNEQRYQASLVRNMSMPSDENGDIDFETWRISEKVIADFMANECSTTTSSSRNQQSESPKSLLTFDKSSDDLAASWTRPSLFSGFEEPPVAPPPGFEANKSRLIGANNSSNSSTKKQISPADSSRVLKSQQQHQQLQANIIIEKAIEAAQEAFFRVLEEASISLSGNNGTISFPSQQSFDFRSWLVNNITATNGLCNRDLSISSMWQQQNANDKMARIMQMEKTNHQSYEDSWALDDPAIVPGYYTSENNAGDGLAGWNGKGHNMSMHKTANR